jgi:hypothetical protein
MEPGYKTAQKLLMRDTSVERTLQSTHAYIRKERTSKQMPPCAVSIVSVHDFY